MHEIEKQGQIYRIPIRGIDFGLQFQSVGSTSVEGEIFIEISPSVLTSLDDDVGLRSKLHMSSRLI